MFIQGGTFIKESRVICAPRDIFENVTKVALNGLITGCQK